MGFSKSKQSSQNSSQQTSESSNQAFPFLQQQLGGQVSNAGVGSKAIADLLGLNGAGQGSEAFNQFKSSSGYDFIQNEGLRNIDSLMASKGVANSGAALKDIVSYNSGLANNFLNSYLSNLSGLSSTGLQAGQILASAGNTSKSQGTSSGSSKGSSTGFNFG